MIESMWRDRVAGNFMVVLIAAVAASVGCSVQPGDCPSAADCACPCSDEVVPVCATSGRRYQNACVAECDGADVGDCGLDGGANVPLSINCDEYCAGDGNAPTCGSVAGDHKTFRWFANDCMLDCQGGKPATVKKCG